MSTAQPELRIDFHRLQPEELPVTCLHLPVSLQSAWLGCIFTTQPLGCLIEQPDPGMWWRSTGCFCLGIASFADVPVSLFADIVTLPLACACNEGVPWATCWGEECNPVGYPLECLFDFVTDDSPGQTCSPSVNRSWSRVTRSWGPVWSSR